MNQLENFLIDSQMAKTIELPAKIILEKRTLSPEEIVKIKENEVYVTDKNSQKVCEFVVGGQSLASGKIVKKGENYFFKVKEIYDIQNKESK